MKKSPLNLGTTLLGVGALLVISSQQAQSQGGIKNLVFLQPATPGVTQSGHASLSGTIRSSQYAASYAGTGLASSAIRGESTAATAFVYGVYGSIASTQGRGVFGYASSTTGTNYGVYGRSLSPDGAGVYGQSGSGTGLGVFGESTSNSGVFGISDSGSGVHGRTIDQYGVYGESTATSGSTYGVRGTTLSVSGVGVRGSSLATSGTNYGVWGSAVSASGYGVYGSGSQVGVRGTASSATGYGVLAVSAYHGIHAETTGNVELASAIYATTDSTANRVYGVLSETNQPDAIGVAGLNSAQTGGSAIGVWAVGGIAMEASGITIGGRGFGGLYGIVGMAGRTTTASTGVVGESHNENGTGVLGQRGLGAIDPGTFIGVNGLIDRGTDRGVLGDSDATSGTPYGVFGDTDGVGWAVYSSGNSGGSGTKSFRIDHPLDPENKYLLHYSSESPEPMNHYSGNVVTGSDGYAWVNLPNYFEQINTDIRYQLTVIDESGEFTQAIVSKKVKGNRFRVRTSRGNVEVSWKVEGVRNDAYVRHYGAPSEVDKDEHERGLFEHPELYGLGKERSFRHDQPAVKANMKNRHQSIPDRKLPGMAKSGKRK